MARMTAGARERMTAGARARMTTKATTAPATTNIMMAPTERTTRARVHSTMEIHRAS